MKIETVNDIDAFAESLGLFAPDREALKMYNRSLVELDDSFAEQAKADFYELARQRAIARVFTLALKLALSPSQLPPVAAMSAPFSIRDLQLDALRSLERELRGRLQRETEEAHAR